jgi:hypothetical protein
VLSYILSALSLARHAVALTLVAGAAATTMVAGSVDQITTPLQQQTAPTTASFAPTTKPEPTAKHDETPVRSSKPVTPEMSAKPQTTTGNLEALVNDCLTKYAALKTSTSVGTAASDACRLAIDASGLTSTEFWTRFAPKTEPTTQPTKPTMNLEALVKDCLTKYAALKTSTTAGTAGTAASDACRSAIEASGLTSTEFWTRFGPKAQPSTAPATSSTNPTTNVEALVKDCFAKYTAAKDSTTAASAASEACRRAIEASALSATEFWAKFGTPQAPKSTPKTTAAPTTPALTQLTKYCLTLHAALTSISSREQVERTTTICNQAITESKLTPAEFWSKFAAYR